MLETGRDSNWHPAPAHSRVWGYAPDPISKKEKIQKSLEDLTEASSKRTPDEQEIQNAKDKRAHAEKELVDSRTPAKTGREH